MAELQPMDFLAAVMAAAKDPDKHAKILRIGERETAIAEKHAAAVTAARAAADDKSEAAAHRAQAEKARDEMAGDLARRIAETETAYQFQIQRDSELTKREQALEDRAKKVQAVDDAMAAREQQVTRKQNELDQRETALNKRIADYNRKLAAAKELADSDAA
jgi:uncharacterized protein involved in exopolysaccharide biosynthesis